MSVPTLGRSLEVAMAGETEQSAMNSVPGAMTAVAQSSNATLLNSTTTLDGKVHNDSPVLSTEDGSSDYTHEHEKTGLEGESAEVGEGSGILTGPRLYLCFSAFMLAVFMFALDQSIVSTAIPVIVSDFQAFDQVAWIITAYFLTQCGLILLVGQLFTVLKAKWILLGAIFFFELGSLICAVAQSMSILIFARAIQGIGASGMFVSILASIVVITRVDQRAAFMSTFGLVFVISSVVGPLLGGVFTQRVSWRWCFWINLPFGGLAAGAVVLLLPARQPARMEGHEGGWRGLKRLDYVGAALVLTLITCLLLALQWGGNQYPWTNWRIIFLFVLGAVLAVVFGFWEVWLDKRALIPKAILMNRTEVATAIAIFMMMCAMLGGTYQLPLYYQAGRAQTPEQSGISIIPFMLAVCVGIFISGGFVAKLGRYYPFLIIGPPIAVIGFALLYTIDEFTKSAKVIGFQILAGSGVGLSFQNLLLAVQAEYSDRPHLIPQATGVISFFQLTGAALGVGIINTVQSVYLNKELKVLAPEAPFEVVRQSVSAIFTLPPGQQPSVIHAYVISITKSLTPIYIALAIALVASVFVRNHNMLKMGGMAAAAAV